MTTTTVVLLSIMGVSYLFSGFVCWLAFLNYFNSSSLLQGGQRYLAIISSLMIVIFWPLWIINKVSRLSSQTLLNSKR